MKNGKIIFEDERYGHLKWGASYRWLFGPNSTRGGIETMAVGKTHPTLSRQPPPIEGIGSDGFHCTTIFLEYSKRTKM